MKEKATKEMVRENFPECVAVADHFKRVFGDGVRMVYANEKGREIGRRRDQGRPSVRLSNTCIYGSLSSDDIKETKRGKKRK